MNKDKYIKQLEEDNKRLREQNAILEKRIGELENRVAEHIINKIGDFSSPFGSNKKHRRRKPGQKPNHTGVTRPLPDHIDEDVELKLNHCPDCGTELNNTIDVRERYVEDIVPQRNYTVKKYKIYRSWCPNCKKIKSPKPTDVLPKSRFGLFLALFVCFQKISLALPINKIQKELSVYFGMQVSQGEISQLITRTAELFGPKFEELKEKLQSIKAINVDETGWKTNGENKWLWTFISKEIALFKIEKSRSHKIPLNILGKKYDGVIGSDRYASYNTLEKKTKSTQQKCWAHLLRNSKELAKFYEEGKIIHRALKSIHKESKELEKEEKESNIQPLLDKIDKLGKKNFESWNCHKFVQSVCKKHRDNLFKFVNNPDVESTNNRAERSLRPLVRIRKISNGNRSQTGERAVEVLMSLIQTYRLQNKDFFKESINFLQSVHIAN